MIAATMVNASALSLAADALPAPSGWLSPEPAPATPGPVYTPPIDAAVTPTEGAPLLYEHTQDAGPDQSFLVVGSALTGDVFVWGRDADDPNGRSWPANVQFADGNLLAATLPDTAYDAPFLVWVRNEAGWSRPVRLNVPQLWWCAPRTVAPGSALRLFGRDLGRRPDRTTAFVYVAPENGSGRWLPVEKAAKYTVTCRVPEGLADGDYRIWVHAGSGGSYGWSRPLTVTVQTVDERDAQVTTLQEGDIAGEPLALQQRIDTVAAAGGGVLELGPGVYAFRGLLRVPGDVVLRGAGPDRTRLQLLQSDVTEFASVGDPEWGVAPGRVHTPEDTMTYRLSVPAAGTWQVWLRYATEMSRWGMPGVSGRMTIQVDDGTPALLQNLPNTGGFGAFRWSRTATVDMSAGEHTLTWRNVKGGGIALDAFAFALDEAYEPGDNPFPKSSGRVIVLQGEDVIEFNARMGTLPQRSMSAVWLAGDGAGLADLTVSGTPQVGTGVLIRAEESLRWIDGCRMTNCRITDIEGKRGRGEGVRLVQAVRALVKDCEIWGQAPIYLSGVRECELADNLLVPISRTDRNALAAVVGRTHIVEECLIAGNRIGSPPGAQAGGPQVMRMIWLSTGKGSVTHNWICQNSVAAPSAPGAPVGAGSMRFGGVAGENQNVGEMILFEANHRTMFFGTIAAADEQSVTLPATLEPTPDERLGSVKRDQLPHDEDGNEIPFWPPDGLDETAEPPITEYYVSVFKGRGQGQTRRVVGRERERLLLDRPWRVAPEPGATVTVGTGYYRNLIVDNFTPDGMTGIQLWISCMENVAAGNSIARMRRPAFYLYSNGTTLASSMPRTWNRGISPLFFNHIEGNRSEECSAGVLLTSGDYPGLPIEFPRALGNVIRHNSFVRSRTDGIVIQSRKREDADTDPAPSIAGTLAEFNLVRDAPVAYHAGHGADHILFRRNHAYFWYPVENTEEPYIAFQTDRQGAVVVRKENTVEGAVGQQRAKGILMLKQPDNPDEAETQQQEK
jgi:hypothetical protein